MKAFIGAWRVRVREIQVNHVCRLGGLGFGLGVKVRNRVRSEGETVRGRGLGC